MRITLNRHYSNDIYVGNIFNFYNGALKLISQLSNSGYPAKHYMTSDSLTDVVPSGLPLSHGLRICLCGTAYLYHTTHQYEVSRGWEGSHATRRLRAAETSPGPKNRPPQRPCRAAQNGGPDRSQAGLILPPPGAFPADWPLHAG